MKSIKITGRIVGVLSILIFVMGVVTYQFLQTPLFSDNYLTVTAASSYKIITSVLVGIISGILSIVISILLLPIFKKYNSQLAYAYFGFCILYFIAIAIDNVSVLSLLELSKQYISSSTGDDGSFTVLSNLLYERHWWTHYLALLISCFPVFILYYTMYISKLVPRVISIFGLVAVLLMFTEEISSIFGHGISMNMLLPIALVQLIFPIWLIIKGFRSQKEHQSPLSES